MNLTGMRIVPACKKDPYFRISKRVYDNGRFMKVYLISGLGADRRIFKNIRLPEGFESVHLDWIEPLPEESLAAYSLRLAGKIDHGESFALIGLSLGGMVASEICKSFSPFITLLISSIPVASHFPYYLRWLSRPVFYKRVPIGFLKSGFIAKTAFSSESPEDRKLLQQMVREVDAGFIYWAIGAIAKWKNEVYPSCYRHIHGTRDKVLPIRFTSPTDRLEGGGHLMVLNRAEEINRFLARFLVRPE
jgi:pimeloyl-ACP methyl ester carboxylesterase